MNLFLNSQKIQIYSDKPPIIIYCLSLPKQLLSTLNSNRFTKSLVLDIDGVLVCIWL